MSGYIETGSYLDKILAHKVEENAACRDQKPLALVEEMAAQAPPARDFVAALQRDTVALIAEVKHASPSRGVLIDPFDPVAIGTTYAANGAAAISVLADEQFFKGNMRYIRAVREAVQIPVLCKEFIIDPYQVLEARACFADAVLLIVAALSDTQLAELHGLAAAQGMAALVEVHNEAETERALKLGARLVGVNNRDLKTFQVDMDTTARLAKLLPPDVLLVAESGIRTAEDVARMGAVGARAVLVGEALVTAADMGGTTRSLSRVARALC